GQTVAAAAAAAAGFGSQTPPLSMPPGPGPMVLPAMMQTAAAAYQAQVATPFGGQQQAPTAGGATVASGPTGEVLGAGAVGMLPASAATAATLHDGGAMAAQLVAMQMATATPMDIQQQQDLQQQQQKQQQFAAAATAAAAVATGGFPGTADLMALSDNALDGTSMGDLGLLAGSDQDLMQSLGFTTTDVGGGSSSAGAFHLSLNITGMEVADADASGGPVGGPNAARADTGTVVGGGAEGITSGAASNGDLANLDLAKNFSFSDLSTMGMSVGMGPMVFGDLGQNQGDGDPMILGGDGGVGSVGTGGGGVSDPMTDAGVGGDGGLIGVTLEDFVLKHEVDMRDFELGFSLGSSK
ncbi:hypothetical protein VaNZ11_008857, partial [Volvox africanus]